jgi:hypothetical protein
MRLFIDNELNNETPILLLHGHTHTCDYEPHFDYLPWFLRMNIAGEAIEPLAIITINDSGQNDPLDVSFRYDGQFPSYKFLLLFRGDTDSYFLRGKICLSFVIHGGNGKSTT